MKQPDEAMLNRLASAVSPYSALPARELVAHVYRIALDVTARKRIYGGGNG